MDELILDDEILDSVSDVIKNYLNAQKEILDEYVRNVRHLENDWEDIQTFDELMHKIENIYFSMENVFNDFSSYYPKYFSERADVIRLRPKYKVEGISQGGGYVSVESQSQLSNIKSCFEQIFYNTNAELKRRIFFYLQKINFIEINAKTSYYDPYGKTKNGLYNNIMAINIDSKTIHDDLLFITGQHIFFYLNRKEQLSLIKCFNDEVKNNICQHDIQFEKMVKNIKTGMGSDFSHIKGKDADYKNAMTFFSYSFKEYIKENKKSINEINKYFSQTYGRFVELLTNLNSLK